MNRTLVIAALMMTFATVSHAQGGHEAMGASAQAVDAACAADATAAKCPEGEKVGTGLIKCIMGAKRSDHAFKISAGCHDAIKTMRAEHKAKKANK